MIKKSILHHKMFWSFFVKKQHNLSFPRITYDIVFFHKKMVLKCKPEWNREAITVFSRLPRLMAADKPCPLLQSSLEGDGIKSRLYYKNYFTLLTTSSSSLSSTLIRTSSSCDVLGFFKIGLKGLWLFLNKLLTFLFNFITFLVEWGEFVVGVKFCLTRLSSKLIVFANREFGKCSRISL